VRDGTLLTSNFVGWTDATLPLRYSVTEGPASIVPPGTDSAPTFALPEGTHVLFGLVTDGLGNFTSAGSVTVVVDGTPPLGGSVTLQPGVMHSGATATVHWSNWLDAAGSAPLSYQIFIDDILTTEPTTADEQTFIAPGIGWHSLKTRVLDSVGNFAETSLSFEVTPSDPLHTASYSTGEVVPGAGGDPNIPAGATWHSFGVPAIDADGRVSFTARWANPSGTPAGHYGGGVFVDGLLRVAVGAPVPGIPEATFRKFRDPVMSSDHLACTAVIDGPGVNSTNDTVLICVRPTGEVTVLAREGSIGTDAGAAKFKAFKSVAIVGGNLDDGPATVLYTARLNTGRAVPTTSGGNDHAAWLFREGATTLVARTGNDLLAGEKFKTFALLENVSGSPAQGRGLFGPEDVLFHAKLSTGRQALVEHRTATAGLRYSGDEVGGTTIPQAIWKSFGPVSHSVETGASVVRGVLQSGPGGVSNPFTTGIFISRNHDVENWEPVVRLGDTAPLLDGVGFKSVEDPVISSTTEQLAFGATLAGAGVNASNNKSLWWTVSGVPTLLAREGSAAPGGGAWSKFTSLAFPGSRGPLVLGTLSPGGTGVWGVDRHGSLRLLFRNGTYIGTRKVKFFAALKAVSGSAGSTRAFNASGRIAWRAHFTDGTSAIVVTHVP
jgi:hypothetical protein